MTKKTLWYLWVTCTLLLSHGFLVAQDVHQIIEKHLEAMGGKEQLSTLKGVKVSSVVSVMGVTMNLQTAVVHQKALRSETDVQGMKIIQVLENGSGWQINPLLGNYSKPISLSKEEVLALTPQLDLTGLLHYQDKGYQVKLLGEDIIQNNHPVYKIQVQTSPDVTTVNYLSKENYLILQTKVQLLVQGQPTVTTIAPSNYKKISGILFPFTSKISTSKMPNEVMISETKRIEVNPDLPSSFFKRP